MDSVGFNRAALPCLSAPGVSTIVELVINVSRVDINVLDLEPYNMKTCCTLVDVVKSVAEDVSLSGQKITNNRSQGTIPHESITDFVAQ